MEDRRNEEVAEIRETTSATIKPEDALSVGLQESLLKLLNYQAQQGANQNNTMILLALMNLLGIVNCMNRILPEGDKVEGTEELAGQIAGMLGGTAPQAAANPNPGGSLGIDPALISALAGMLGTPPAREAGGRGEATRPGIDPAMLAALAGMMGSPGQGGGMNTTALLGMLANMIGPPPRPQEQAKPKEHPVGEEKAPQPEEKARQNTETVKKEPVTPPRGILRWDPRLGSPTSSS